MPELGKESTDVGDILGYIHRAKKSTDIRTAIKALALAKTILIHSLKRLKGDDGVAYFKETFK